MAIKLIALDIDGTLLNSKMEVTAAAVEALNKAVARGIHIVLSTGRLVVECADILEKLPCIRYVNGCTGAEVTDLKTGRSVAGRRISGDEARRIYSKLKDLPIMFCAFDPKDGAPHCSRELWQQGIDHWSPPVRRHIKKFYTPEDSFEDYIGNVQELIKVYMPCFTQEALVEVKRRMAAEPYTVVQCSATDMEIMPVGADKGAGLEQLAQVLGLTSSEVMAIGDSENDLSMLRYAGLPVVMANGSDEAKALAKFMTDDNDHDGVAKAVNMVLEGTL